MKKSLGATNTPVFPTPVFIVGTYNKDGTPNAMAAAWGGVCSSVPPCVTVSIRKERQSHINIMERGAFTINVTPHELVKEADYFGIVSGKTRDKFAGSGLTPVAGSLVEAPYISEFPIVLECRVINTVEIGLHTMFIGEILDAKVDEDLLVEDRIDIESICPVMYSSHNKAYYATGKQIANSHSVGKALV